MGIPTEQEHLHVFDHRGHYIFQYCKNHGFSCKTFSDNQTCSLDKTLMKEATCPYKGGSGGSKFIL
jgi:hypothetical protein